MDFSNKIKYWLDKNKKYVQIGSAVTLALAGVVLCKDKKIPFPDEIKSWSLEKLHAEYDKWLPEFHRTNVKPLKMQQIDHEISLRNTFTKHLANIDPNFRWTDINRWDKD